MRIKWQAGCYRRKKVGEEKAEDGRARARPTEADSERLRGRGYGRADG